MKSKLMKAVATGGIALAAVGIGAGVASAEPNHNPAPQSGWEQNQHNDGWDQNQHNDGRDQYNDGRDHHNDRWNDRDHRWEPAPAPHGFWFFNQWIPTPW